MFQSIIHRKASPLGALKWSTLPWYRKRNSQGQNDIFPMLYDHGFAMAALLEEIDNAHLTNGNASTEITQRYLQRCSAMDAKLDSWYQELVCRSEGPLYWLTPVDDSILSGPAYQYWASVSNNNRPFSFPNLRTANIITLYWAFKLELSRTIANICVTALSNPISILPAPLQSAAQQMLIQHGEIDRLQNARNILRSLPYCLQDSMGFLGALRSMCALRAAHLSLRRSQMDELNLCAQLYRDLYEKKGLAYAKQIADMGPKWGVHSVMNLSSEKDSADKAGD